MSGYSGTDNYVTSDDMDTLADHFADYSGYITTIIKELINMQKAMASLYDGKAKDDVSAEFDKLIAHYKVLKDSSDTMKEYIYSYLGYMLASDDNQKNRVDETLNIQQPC